MWACPTVTSCDITMVTGVHFLEMLVMSSGMVAMATGTATNT